MDNPKAILHEKDPNYHFIRKPPTITNFKHYETPNLTSKV